MEAMPAMRGGRLRAAVWVLGGAFMLAALAAVAPWSRQGDERRLTWLALALAFALFTAMVRRGRMLLQHEVVRRESVETALRERQRSHQAVLDGMPHPIAVRDAQARLLFCNVAYLKLLGLPMHRLLAHTLVESITEGANVEEVRAAHQRYLALLTDRLPMSHDADIHVGDQVRRVMHWASALPDRQDGRGAGLVCGFVDVTERHRLAQLIESARAKAEAVSRAKSSYLANMSHEIRTPMNAVLGVLELLLREGRLAPPDRESVELALGAARALLGLIDDALDLSKVEAGAMDMVARPVRIAELVREAAALFQGRASQRGLDLRVEIDEALCGWHGVDGPRLRQVVGNLVANAIRFTDRGEVVVRLSSMGTNEGMESVLLEVSDTGIGMGPEEVRKLFRPFFQAESAGMRAHGGTGLGLAIVQGLCARMGGEIEVQSLPGAGTTIRARLHFPVVAPPAAGSEPDEERKVERAVPERGRFNILVVDDHPANRLLLQRQLGFLGYRSELAQDGRQALDRWRAGGINAVITDCTMPVMDGYALASEIRAIEQGERDGGPRCPILGFTAHVREQDRHKALDAGMDDCLAKPLGLDELLQALQRHLQEAPDAPRPDVQADPSCDLDSLAAISGGDAKVEAQFLAALLDANIDDLDALAQLVHAGERSPDIATLAHRIKGPARLVRARQVVQDCEALEAAFASDRTAELGPAFAALQASLGRFNDMLSKRLQAGGSLAH